MPEISESDLLEIHRFVSDAYKAIGTSSAQWAVQPYHDLRTALGILEPLMPVPEPEEIGSVIRSTRGGRTFTLFSTHMNEPWIETDGDRYAWDQIVRELGSDGEVV